MKTKAKDHGELFGQEPPGAKSKKGEIVKFEVRPPLSVLAIISDAAANPNVDVAKMKELLAMQREVMAEEARIAFTQDFIAMSREMPSVNKDGKIVIEKNDKVIQRTPYATFENMHRVVSPILRVHGFAFWSEPDLGNESSPIVMRGHLDHVKGHGKTCAIPLPFETSGSKNNVQGVGSSLAYGRRYCLMNLCNIISHATDDKDRDGAAPKVEATEAVVLISKKQATELTAAIDDCGVPLTTFCKKYEVEKIEDLPVAMFDEAMKNCALFKANREQKR